MANSRKSGVGGVLATGRGAIAMLRAAAEDTVAAFDLLHVTGADGPPADPFAAPPPPPPPAPPPPPHQHPPPPPPPRPPNYPSFFLPRRFAGPGADTGQ